MSRTDPHREAPTDAPGTDGGDRVHWVDVAGLALLALVVRIPAYLADKGLTFDDGVFASSAIAMRDGGVPFRDVFSSQGPLFLPLVALGDAVGMRTLDSPRVLAVLSGVVAVVATYWTALRLTDRVGAVLAGGLLAVSGGLAWVTGPLAADGPALAFAAITMGLTLRHRDTPTLWRAGLVGAALGAVLSTKSLEAPIVVPVALVLLAPVVSAARRRAVDTTGLLHGVVAGVAAVGVFLVVTVPFGFADVWDQSVVYRTDAASERDIPATAGEAPVHAVGPRPGAAARRRRRVGVRRAGPPPHRRRTYRRGRPRRDLGVAPSMGSGRHVGLVTVGTAAVGDVAGGHAGVAGARRQPAVATARGRGVDPAGPGHRPVPPTAPTAGRCCCRGGAAGRVAAGRPAGDRRVPRAPRRSWSRRSSSSPRAPGSSATSPAWCGAPGGGPPTTSSTLRCCGASRTATPRTPSHARRRTRGSVPSSASRTSGSAYFDGLPDQLEAQGYVADPDVGDGDVLYVRSDCTPTG